MWPEMIKHLQAYPNAVLTGLDAQSYPFSIRCSPQIDESCQLLLIAPAGEDAIQPGPAGLMCHAHNELLWEIKSFQIQGRLEKTGAGWVFHPQRLIPGEDAQTMMGQFRTLFKSRASAKKYLDKRGLPWPKVDWVGFAEVKAKARKSWPR
jgi:hypothetical protein